MITRRLLLTAAIVLPLSARLSVYALSSAHAQSSAQAAGPTAPIKQLDQALLAALQAGKTQRFPARYNILAPVIERVFDLQTILRNSVGLTWSQLPPDQQSALLQVFRVYTVCSYAANFDDYNGQRFEVSPDTRAVGAQQVVSTTITGPGGTHRIDYVMQQADAGWQVVDVLVDGSISRVATQRSDFRSLVRGRDASRLIASLQRKVADLSGGTVAS